MQSRHAVLRFLLLIGSAMVFVTNASAQTDKATAVVSEMIAALGGKSFLEVREIQASGKVFVFKHDAASGSEVFADYIKFPDKERQELGTYRIKPTDIFNGDMGWTIYLPKVDPKSAADIREFQSGFKTSFQYLTRYILNRPELVLQHVGTELVDFKRNDVIEFRDSGNLFRLYVDQQTHLPTKMQVRRSGESILREEQFANWHDFQGIRTALYVIHFKDGERISEIRFDNVSYNPGLADSLFAPPAAR
jgi:hypothetical protein